MMVSTRSTRPSRGCVWTLPTSSSLAQSYFDTPVVSQDPRSRLGTCLCSDGTRDAVSRAAALPGPFTRDDKNNNRTFCAAARSPLAPPLRACTDHGRRSTGSIPPGGTERPDLHGRGIDTPSPTVHRASRLHHACTTTHHPTGAPPGTGRSESALTRDRVDVRVAFDDDASAMQVLLECNRAMSSPTDAAANGAPDVIIATLRPGVDPDLAADALHAELEPDDSSARATRATNVSDVSRFVFLFRERRGALTVRANAAARRRHDVEKTPGHLNVVLAAPAAPARSWDPRDAPAAATPLITAEELRGLRAWNDASYRPQYLPLQPVTRATTLPARIAEIAAAHPTAPAVSPRPPGRGPTSN